MSLRFASLGSGSRGNATLIQYQDTLVLVDCGFSIREIERRLEQRGCQASALDAILVTHEHSDHIGGVGRLARKHALPVYATAGTRRGCASQLADESQLHTICAGQSFAIGALQISPVTVPHDAREPCQYVFAGGEHRLGLLTDTGSITPHILAQYADCDALLLEFNHDRHTLMHNPDYPASLKRRIGGSLGHLSNQQAQQLLQQLAGERLQVLCAMHLSEKNNSPQQVRELVEQVLGQGRAKVSIAGQDEGFDWYQLQPV